MNKTEQENYIDASLYFALIETARKYNDKISHASPQEYLNIVNIENGTAPKFLPSSDILIKDIIKKLTASIKTFLKIKELKSENVALTKALEDVKTVYSSDQIIDLVKVLLLHTQQLKNQDF